MCQAQFLVLEIKQLDEVRDIKLLTQSNGDDRKVNSYHQLDQSDQVTQNSVTNNWA